MQVIFFIAFFFLLVYAVLIIYYRQSWKSAPDFSLQATGAKGVTTISIIIPARNEALQIGACLQSISNQSYSKELYEVIVIDDHSADNTAAIVLNSQLPNVKLVSLKDFIASEAINAYKKKAIETGISQSSGELIITTDADCIAPPNWLQTIAAFYEEKEPSFIVMPVVINYSHRFIEVFQSLDFMTLQGITGASVHKKFHSMCNGANVAYTRKAFIDASGFAGIDGIASGDDMLLMHKIAALNPAAVLFLKSKEVIMQTQPVHTVKDFFNQRIRWASKADKYDDKRIFAVLLMVYVFNLLLLIMPVIALFTNPVCSIGIYPLTFTATVWELWIFLLITKTVVELFFLFPVAGFFKKQSLLWYFPLLQPFHILYMVIAGWLGKFGTYQWKDRKVK